MPAGDLLTGDWQAEIRTTLTGAGTNYRIEYGGIDLGGEEVKSNDTNLVHDHGVYLGRDYNGPRVITVAYSLRGTAAAVGGYYLTLRTLWAVSEATDLELHLQLPGLGHLSFVGRPRGLTSDMTNLQVGHVRALATFFCGDPTLTVVP